MSEDKRTARRSDNNVVISIGKIGADKNNIDYVDVTVLNISETGVGFLSKEKLDMDAFYDSVVKIKNGDRVKAIIRIVRARELDVGGYEYGAQLLGLSYADKLKIGIFQMVND